VELDANESVGTLKAILEAESGLPALQQQLLHHGKPLPAARKVNLSPQSGIADGDILMLLPKQPCWTAAAAAAGWPTAAAAAAAAAT